MGMWTAASSQPDSVSPTHPVGETVTMTEALSAKEDSEIKKKKAYVYCSKSCASCDQPKLSKNSFIPDQAHFTSIHEEKHWKPFSSSWRLSAFMGP